MPLVEVGGWAPGRLVGKIIVSPSTPADLRSYRVPLPAEAEREVSTARSTRSTENKKIHFLAVRMELERIAVPHPGADVEIGRLPSKRILRPSPPETRAVGPGGIFKP